MKKRTKNKVDSTGVSPDESQMKGSADCRTPHDTNERTFTSISLAHVEFESNWPSTTDELDLLKYIFHLEFEGMPDLDALLSWMIADNVLIHYGPPVGLVPAYRYVEAGLFSCSVNPVIGEGGVSTPFVLLHVTPKGVMWIKETYVPTPERHRHDYAPEDLRGPID